eukprot:scaffold21986_cov167-Isochrysis_galbana.AAC.1
MPPCLRCRQWRLAALRLNAHVGASGEQEGRTLGIAHAARRVQRRRAAAVARVHVCARIEQQLEAPATPQHARAVERGGAARIDRIAVGARLQDELRADGVPLQARCVQRCRAVARPGCGARSGSQQQLQAPPLALDARRVQRRCPTDPLASWRSASPRRDPMPMPVAPARLGLERLSRFLSPRVVFSTGPLPPVGPASPPERNCTGHLPTTRRGPRTPPPHSPTTTLAPAPRAAPSQCSWQTESMLDAQSGASKYSSC